MANGTYDNPRAGSNSSKNRMKSMMNKVNDPKKSTLDKSDEISQDYMLPELEVSSKVEQIDGDFEFSKDRVYNKPNPKATKSNPKDIKKKISNSPSSREMEVEREDQDSISGLTDPTPDRDYSKFMKSTGRFPKIYK
tara:strand:- start:3147 stop:3557 length:411 start_codon:yes stop_codon:yes gene_type:complete